MEKDDSALKRLCHYFEEYLKDDIQKYRDAMYKLIRDLGIIHRNRVIKSISHQVLAAVINIDLFEEKGLTYSYKNQVDLSIDIAFILSSVAQLISK